MKFSRLRGAALLTCLAMTSSFAGAQVREVTEPIALFNGKDLTGFYRFVQNRGVEVDPKQVFTVQDGMIRISGEEYGCITSNESFDRYKIVMEFKWGQKTWGSREKATRDSGLLVHSVGEDGGYSGIWKHSIEVQLIEGGTGDFIVVGDGTDTYSLTANVADEMQGTSHVFKEKGKPATINSGRINWWGRSPDWVDELGFRGEHDVEKPVGEWNTVEVTVDAGKIDVFLNGILVNGATDTNPKSGQIQIQSEGAELFVRKVELLPLKNEVKP